jgi:outer membrane immunogenic protein
MDPKGAFGYIVCSSVTLERLIRQIGGLVRRSPIAIIVAAYTVAFIEIASAGAVSDWTGFYAGLNAGGGWEKKTATYNSLSSHSCTGDCVLVEPNYAAVVPQGEFTADRHPLGFLGGGQIGYNLQTGAFVWGAETDFQGSNIKGTDSAGPNTITYLDINYPGEQLYESVEGRGSRQINWIGTLRGRVGWLPINSLLVYATGGLAYAHTQTTVSFTGIGPAFVGGILPSPWGGVTTVSNSTIRTGWTLGGGLESRLDQHWSIKGEYLYYDLGNETLNSTLKISCPSCGAPGNLTTITLGMQSVAVYRGNIVRLGANYRF